MATTNRAKRSRGGALLTVLWLSAALGAISFSLASTVRSEIERSSTQSDGLRAFYLASGSVERGIQWMLWGPLYRADDGTARFWEPGQPHLKMRYASGDVLVEMIPEMAKLNINTAGFADLSRLITILTNDPARAQVVATGIVIARGAAGMPDLISNGGTSTFRPPNTSFQEIEELLTVRGMTPELFYGNFVTDAQGTLYPTGGLRDCVSVWGSSDGPYDANTVSPALMLALGVNQAAVNRVLAWRRLRPIRTPEDLSGLGVSSPRIGIGGNLIWTLRGTARLRDAAGQPTGTVRTAAATVKILDGRVYQTPLHVLRWYDDAWSMSAIAPAGPVNIAAPIERFHP